MGISFKSQKSVGKIIGLKICEIGPHCLQFVFIVTLILALFGN
jgi:hypothetical protein